jgi:hypothetical protein
MKRYDALKYTSDGAINTYFGVVILQKWGGSL